MEQQLQVSIETAMESKPSSNHKEDLNVERTGIKEIDEGLYWPLSGKPYADMIITKTAVNPPYGMHLPRKLSKELPPNGAPAVLTYGRKSWDMFFCGSNANSRFSPSEWRRFADDNNLKVGDGLLLELSECSTSKIHFKVLILRETFPKVRPCCEAPRQNMTYHMNYSMQLCLDILLVRELYRIFLCSVVNAGARPIVNYLLPHIISSKQDDNDKTSSALRPSINSADPIDQVYSVKTTFCTESPLPDCWDFTSSVYHTLCLACAGYLSSFS